MKDIVVSNVRKDDVEPIFEINSDDERILKMHRNRISNKVNNIKKDIVKLPDTLRGKGQTVGITFRKVEEGDNYYIYHSIDTGTFELFEKRIRRGKEIYPDDEDFGEWALSLPNLTMARNMALKKYIACRN